MQEQNDLIKKTNQNDLVSESETINENGRSMVEMLGVLAIVGVLSIGGIAGYNYAINKHHSNENLNALSKGYMLASTAIMTGNMDFDALQAMFDSVYKGMGTSVLVSDFAGQIVIQLENIKAKSCEMMKDQTLSYYDLVDELTDCDEGMIGYAMKHVGGGSNASESSGCINGQRRCSGNQVQECFSGSWSNQEFCQSGDYCGLTESGAVGCTRSSNCTVVGEQRCGIDYYGYEVIQECTSGGNWATMSTCMSSYGIPCVQNGTHAQCGERCETEGAKKCVSGAAYEYYGGGVHICQGGEWKHYDTCHYDASCEQVGTMAGCGGVCETTGAMKCSNSGSHVLICSSAGSGWVDYDYCAWNNPCSQSGTKAGCGGVCETTGAMKCGNSSTQVLICSSAGGGWAHYYTCEDSVLCSQNGTKAACGGICETTGAMKCDNGGSHVYICSSAGGGWSNWATCETYTCSSSGGYAQCGSFCTPGYMKCSDGNVHICSGDSYGKWDDSAWVSCAWNTPCQEVGSRAGCGGVCSTHGAKRCDTGGSYVLICNVSDHWPFYAGWTQDERCDAAHLCTQIDSVNATCGS